MKFARICMHESSTLNLLRWLVALDKYASPSAIEVQMSRQHYPDFWTGLLLWRIEFQHQRFEFLQIYDSTI